MYVLPLEKGNQQAVRTLLPHLMNQLAFQLRANYVLIFLQIIFDLGLCNPINLFLGCFLSVPYQNRM